jgi:acyl carrier protein
MPKTTSGKIQRYKLAERYVKNDFNNVIEEMKLLIDQFKARVKEEQKILNVKETDFGSEVTGELMKVEKEVLEIFKEVLGHDEIDVYESFFSLGASSIMLGQIYFKLQDRFSVNIALTDLFNYHNIRMLSKFICQGHKIPKTEEIKSVESEIEEIIEKMALGHISADKFAESLIT